MSWHPTYHTVVGSETLIGDDIDRVFPSAKSEERYGRSKYMTPSLAQDFRTWLVEPDYAQMAQQPLALTSKQRSLIVEPPPSGHRMKGPAGSGKSIVLAARASFLSARQKDVLVISFN